MTIKGIIDLDTGHFLNAEGTADMGSIEIQAQETVKFMLRFREAGLMIADHTTIDDMDIVFAAKPTTDYTGTDYFAYQTSWTKNASTHGYDGEVDFYTAELVAGIANTGSLSMHGQFKVNDYPDTDSGDGVTRFSQLFSITVKNDVIAASGTASPVLFPRLVSSGTAPAATNDTSEGYAVGSVWIVTGASNAAYMCIDNTEDAAIWSEMTSETGAAYYNSFGVGTASPQAPVHLYKAATTSNQRLEMLRLELADEGVDMNVGHGPGIDFYVGETSGSGYGGTLAVVREQASDVNDAAAMVFHTTTDDGVADPDKEKLRITSTGNIGIGDNDPGTLVQVTGSAPYLTIKNNTAENTDGGCESRIIFEDHADATLAQIQVSHDGSSDDTKGDIIISTSDGSSLDEALRIDSDQLATFAGSIAVGGTVDGVDIAARDSVHSSTKVTADAALQRSGGTMTGAISGIQFGNNADANYNKLTNLTDGSSDQDAVAFTQLRTPANTQTGTTYTLVLADARKTVRLNNASTVTVTVPKSIFAAGDVITLFRKGAGGVTITPVDSDVTINSVGTKRKLASQYSAATLICVTGGGTPEFDLIGDLTT